MSGHSKWATIKRAKAANDAKRGAIFTKIANLITVAVKEKGPDPETNFTLRMAMDKARSANMPKDNIERAIKRGSGEGGADQIDELLYEGIGPANIQVIIKSLTDNKNRSASNIRHLLTKVGGSLGSVMWNFEQKGVILIVADILKEKNINFDDLELELIDAGAEDIQKDEDGITIITAMSDLQSAAKFFEDKDIKTESAEIEYIAKDKVDLDEAEYAKYESFIESLEDCEDVSAYYTNVKD